MSAIQQLLTDHLHIWTAADAEKKSGRGRSSSNAASVYGIKKLRELILELAVRGKLVPQDPSDEPASQLLKKIQTEKAKLIAEGKIKKEKSLPAINESETPFNLPAGWVWEKLGNVFSFEYGDNLPAEKRSNTGEFLVYGSNGVVGSHNISFVSSPCIVIGRKGSAGALNLCLAKGCCVTDVAYYCVPPNSLDLVFSFKLFHTLGLDDLGKGIKPGLSRNEAYELPIAIPPLAEQHLIVAKVDELMALCDQLETQHNNTAEAHEKLVSQLLDTLTHLQSADEFRENWQRIAAHFDTLFTTESSIDALKQTLLQLAVMGKLVPQDPNDEPASELLKKIQAKKTKLIAEGKIKKEKPLPPVSEEGKPFPIPRGWEWTSIDKIAQVGTGATPLRTKSEYFNPPAISWVTSGETSQSHIFETEQYVSPLAVSETNLTVYPKGTLIVAMYGQGKTRGQITELMIDACTNQACAAIQLLDGNDYHRKYVKLFFEKIYDEIRELAAGGAQPRRQSTATKPCRCDG